MTWRKIVMQWFALAEQDAKKTLLQACFGFAFPSRASGKPVICPLLEGLAADAMKLRAAMCQRHPSLLAAMRAAGRPRPESSTMAFLLFEKENQAMQAFCKLLPKYGFALVAPVFDAVLAVPQSTTEEDGSERVPNQDALLNDFRDSTGIMMQVKALSRTRPQATVPNILRELLSNNMAIRMDPVRHLPGRFSCIGTALLNLSPDEANDIKEATSNLSSPISYHHAMEICPNLLIEPASFDQATQCGDGTCFLVHASNTWDVDVGHAYGVKMVQATAHIYTSTEEECIQTNAQLLWQKLAKTPGTYIFKVCIVNPDGEPQAKRRKKDGTSTTSVELLLKAGAVEAEETFRPVMPQVRESMSREVSQQLARPKLSSHGCKVHSVLATPNVNFLVI